MHYRIWNFSLWIIKLTLKETTFFSVRVITVYVLKNNVYAGGGGAQRLLWVCWWAQKDGCAQRTGGHARPKPDSLYIFQQNSIVHTLKSPKGSDESELWCCIVSVSYSLTNFCSCNIFLIEFFYDITTAISHDADQSDVVWKVDKICTNYCLLQCLLDHF